MREDYGLEQGDVEDTLDRWLEDGVREGDTAQSLSEDYAEKYDLVKLAPHPFKQKPR
jgi:uncharacterized membrane protein